MKSIIQCLLSLLSDFFLKTRKFSGASPAATGHAKDSKRTVLTLHKHSPYRQVHFGKRENGNICTRVMVFPVAFLYATPKFPSRPSQWTVPDDTLLVWQDLLRLMDLLLSEHGKDQCVTCAGTGIYAGTAAPTTRWTASITCSGWTMVAASSSYAYAVGTSCELRRTTCTTGVTSAE